MQPIDHISTAVVYSVAPKSSSGALESFEEGEPGLG